VLLAVVVASPGIAQINPGADSCSDAALAELAIQFGLGQPQTGGSLAIISRSCRVDKGLVPLTRPMVPAISIAAR
jgi:hypothetical protein